MLGRSLMLKASGARLLYPTYVKDYLDRVTALDVAAGDTQGLELGVTDAISTCLQALVADGILGVSGGVLAQAASLIKASCAMQGARTLPGALVPLAADMPAPTNFNFVAGDYNRRTGLGDPANVSKYLNSNRAGNADLQDNHHMAVFASTAANGSSMGAGITQTGTSGLGRRSPSGFTNTAVIRSQNGGVPSAIDIDKTDAPWTSGFLGLTRSSSSSFVGRSAGTEKTFTVSSQAPYSQNIYIFGRNNDGVLNDLTAARLNFYSMGSALNLAILDARITALSTAIQAAIP